jgi:hypothetical protein
MLKLVFRRLVTKLVFFALYVMSEFIASDWRLANGRNEWQQREFQGENVCCTRCNH